MISSQERSNIEKLFSAAVEQKMGQLEKIKNGTLKPEELAAIITERRVNWMRLNMGLIEKYSHLTTEEMAHRIIYFDHMHINPEHSKVKRIGRGIIRIDSHNICPYFEACQKLGLDTKFVCKEIGEPSMREMCKMIHPKLRFTRDYQNGLRPYNPDFCREYIIKEAA